MVIPVNAQPGTTSDMTCPDEQNYYVWEGKPTSAQYYLNNKGISIEEGCIWGNGSSPIGNWAPINLGVGQSQGTKWLSIFPNLPTSNAQLDFSVELVGDNLAGSCKYSNGQYCTDTGCSATEGCTVSSDSVELSKSDTNRVVRSHSPLATHISSYRIDLTTSCCLVTTFSSLSRHKQRR